MSLKILKETQYNYIFKKGRNEGKKERKQVSRLRYVGDKGD